MAADGVASQSQAFVGQFGIEADDEGIDLGRLHDREALFREDPL